MDKLAHNIVEATDLVGSPVEKLKEANRIWAEYVLKTDTEDALKWGLEICRAIAEYINEVEFER